MRASDPLLLLWELPQTLLGAALFAAEKALGTIASATWERGRVFVHSRGSAVSLGWFVFYAEGETRWFSLDDQTKAHEHGHSFQSRMLGPLYLPLVGVPSVARVIYAIGYREIVGARWTGYFDGYPESWADRLGGVVRTTKNK